VPSYSTSTAASAGRSPASSAVAPPPDALVAILAFPAPLLPDGRATLLAWQDADDLADAKQQLKGQVTLALES
jgi:hypothetical protein